MACLPQISRSNATDIFILYLVGLAVKNNYIYIYIRICKMYVTCKNVVYAAVVVPYLDLR